MAEVGRERDGEAAVAAVELAQVAAPPGRRVASNAHPSIFSQTPALGCVNAPSVCVYAHAPDEARGVARALAHRLAADDELDLARAADDAQRRAVEHALEETRLPSQRRPPRLASPIGALYVIVASASPAVVVRKRTSLILCRGLHGLAATASRSDRHERVDSCARESAESGSRSFAWSSNGTDLARLRGCPSPRLNMT